MHKYFVTGIDTDSGKTLACAILCEALKADYWKPVQSGLPRDSDTIQNLISNDLTRIHPETFLLKTPASPHAAADIDGVKIQLKDFKLPQTNNTLIIEGAGGTLVPLNEKNFMVDLMLHLNAGIIVVADLYLGSINHTLLTIEALKNRNLKIKGIIFNGDTNAASESIILKHSKTSCLLKIKSETEINRDVVLKYASELKSTFHEQSS